MEDEQSGVSKSAVDKITISDITISDIPYASNWQNAVDGKLETRRQATANVTNDNDFSCGITISFEYEESNVDNYGDIVVKTKTENHVFSLAANESRHVVTLLNLNAQDDNTSTCTGNVNYSIQKYDDGNDYLLPVSAITNTDITNQGSAYGEESKKVADGEEVETAAEVNDHTNVIFTIPNETTDRWKWCLVDFDFYYDGVYIDCNGSYFEILKWGDNWCAGAEYIKSGKTVDVVADFGTNTLMDSSKFSVVVTGVTYSVMRIIKLRYI